MGSWGRASGTRVGRDRFRAVRQRHVHDRKFCTSGKILRARSLSRFRVETPQFRHADIECHAIQAPIVYNVLEYAQLNRVSRVDTIPIRIVFARALSGNRNNQARLQNTVFSFFLSIADGQTTRGRSESGALVIHAGKGLFDGRGAMVESDGTVFYAPNRLAGRNYFFQQQNHHERQYSHECHGDNQSGTGMIFGWMIHNAIF